MVSLRRGPDDSVGAEPLPPTQQSSHDHGGSAAGGGGGHASSTTVIGAVPIDGLDAVSHDGTVFWRPADDDRTVYTRDSNPSVPPITATAHVVEDTEEEMERLREQNRRLQERERMREEGVVVAQAIDDDGRTNDNGCSQGCRRAAIVAVVVAVLIIAIVVPVILTQPSGAGTVTTRPAPTTAAPTQSLEGFLSSVSPDGGDALATAGTPQHQAVNWLAGNANLDSYSDAKKIQRYTLAAFYYSTGGNTWTNRDNWLDDGEECDRWWQDDYPSGFSTLQCTDSGALVSLDLRLNNLQGTLPPEIGLLSGSLESLELKGNFIGGPIPSQIGTLTNLVELWLVLNSFTGTIPSEIGGLTKLTSLAHWVNQLTGTIPSELASLTNLEYLSLHTNQLTGTIPTFFERMTNLDYLSLYGNQFTGTFTCPDFVYTCDISCSDDTNEQCRTL